MGCAMTSDGSHNSRPPRQQTRAEKAFGVQEGLPTDSNNVSPRIGIAWDPWGDGKTVIRAGYGFFYDNPALALTFLATAEDGARSSLLQFPGACTPDGSLNAASIFQGILNSPTAFAPATRAAPPQPPTCATRPTSSASTTFSPIPCYQSKLPYCSNPECQAVGYPLVGPFTIPITKNFQYALAQQANLSIEREITKDWKVSVDTITRMGLTSTARSTSTSRIRPS